MIEKLKPSLLAPNEPETDEGIIQAIDEMEDKINEIIEVVNHLQEYHLQVIGQQHLNKKERE